MQPMNLDKSGRARLFDPLRVWLGIFVAMLVLQIASSVSLWRTSEAENQILVDIQRQTLVRARLDDLEAGNFRAVVEGLGAEFPRLFVEIESGQSTFRYGALPAARKCSLGPVALHSVKAGSVSFRLCRPYEFPLFPFAGVIALFFVASAFCLMTIARAEKAAVETLTGFFTSQGIEETFGRGFAGVLSKLTDMVRCLEEAKRREIEFIKAEALLDVADQVAHDIVSPLATLVVLMRPDSPLTEEDQPLVRSALDRIRAIANDLMDRAEESRPVAPFGEVTSSKIKRKAEPSAQVQPVLPLVADLVSEKQVEFLERREVTFSTDYGNASHELFVKIDGQSLKRALSNVINNAVEALGSPGTVTVSIATYERDVVVGVRDDGRGISADTLAQLNTSVPVPRKAGGRGLGLRQARSVVHDAGGKLQIRSELGRGTTVELWLPMARSSSQAKG